MTDLNDNAKAAVREFADYIGQSDKCERYLEHVTTKKTVADAVEWHKSKGWGVIWANEDKDCITHGQLGFAFADSKNLQVGRKLVCTREQFEAYVKEQEGEKWTHTLLGDKAYIKLDEPDCHGYVLVVTESNGYNLARPGELKPIKPTMTAQDEAALVEFMKSSHKLEVINEVKAYISERDII